MTNHPGIEARPKPERPAASADSVVCCLFALCSKGIGVGMASVRELPRTLHKTHSPHLYWGGAQKFTLLHLRSALVGGGQRNKGKRFC